MIKRAFYKPKNKLISTQNEPDLVGQDTARYPDMYETYLAFQETYHIGFNNFILTNGCENALRIALIALRIKNLIIENPTWAMAEIIADSLDINYKKINYIYNNKFELEPYSATNDWLYTTDSYNNLFRHDNYNTSIFSNVILDETYTLQNLLNPDRQLTNNLIIIGSFSKFAGCGLRIGYVLFNESMEERFHMLRESYLSSAACNFIQKRQKISPNLNMYDEMYPIVTKHSCYTTYAENPGYQYPHKEFKVNGRTFYRFGTVYR